MPWVRLEDNFYEHPKIADRSLAAVGLWALGLGYCNRWLTDGHLPTKAARLLGATKKLTDELEAAGLWEKVDGGWHYHDYHDRQPTAESVRQRREERAQSGKKGADKRWGKDGNSHSSSHGNSHSNGHGNPDGDSDAPYPEALLVEFYSSSSSVDARPVDDDDHRWEPGQAARAAAVLLARRALDRRLADLPDQPIHHQTNWLLRAETDLWAIHSHQLVPLSEQGLDPEDIADRIEAPNPSPGTAAGPRCSHCRGYHDSDTCALAALEVGP